MTSYSISTEAGNSPAFSRVDDAAGGSAHAGSFGFFGRVGLRAGFGGGATGSSCATTGLGSIRVVPGVKKPAGLPLTRTGTVTGLKSFRV
jgi:hypothetical protein